MFSARVTRSVVGLAVLALICFLAGAALISPASARTHAYPPLDRPGPPLDVPASALAHSLSCTANLVSSGREAVLLVPGTTLEPTMNFGWNYERAFNAQHRPWCAVTLPQDAMGDIQVAGEYVVHAIRTMHARTGLKIQILGHSQGGMVPRWALRFWPDTRAMVDDVIGMAPSNHGTVDAPFICVAMVGCAPAIWQQQYGAPFIKALNSGAETFAGISYTDIYTQLDEIVVPNLSAAGSSSLHTGRGQITNVALQQICPAHVADHLLIGTSDPVAYALVMDALNHPGPAVPSRIHRSVCGRLLQPGVNPGTFVTDFGKAVAFLTRVLLTSPRYLKPPPLKAYARG